jgi:hypothetical protein
MPSQHPASAGWQGTRAQHSDSRPHRQIPVSPGHKVLQSLQGCQHLQALYARGAYNSLIACRSISDVPSSCAWTRIVIVTAWRHVSVDVLLPRAYNPMLDILYASSTACREYPVSKRSAHTHSKSTSPVLTVKLWDSACGPLPAPTAGVHMRAGRAGCTSGLPVASGWAASAVAAASSAAAPSTTVSYAPATAAVSARLDLVCAEELRVSTHLIGLVDRNQGAPAATGYHTVHSNACVVGVACVPVPQNNHGRSAVRPTHRVMVRDSLEVLRRSPGPSASMTPAAAARGLRTVRRLCCVACRATLHSRLQAADAIAGTGCGCRLAVPMVTAADGLSQVRIRSSGQLAGIREREAAARHLRRQRGRCRQVVPRQRLKQRGPVIRQHRNAASGALRSCF